jgi:hypothetical protein
MTAQNRIEKNENGEVEKPVSRQCLRVRRIVGKATVH